MLLFNCVLLYVGVIDVKYVVYYYRNKWSAKKTHDNWYYVNNNYSLEEVFFQCSSEGRVITASYVSLKGEM